MTRSELIAALRDATGPDRELDAEIAALLRIVPEFRAEHYIVPLAYRPYGERIGWVSVWASYPDGSEHCCHARAAPAFTTSIDAALTLLPDELWWLFGKGKTRDDEPLYGVRLFNPGDFESAIVEAEHATSSAIALCVVALEAIG